MHKNYKIMFAVPCAHSFEHPAVRTWMVNSALQLREDPRFNILDGGGILMHTGHMHRIHCCRNLAAQEALKADCDFLLFCDADQVPDMRMANPFAEPGSNKEERKWARPFVTSSLDFMLQNHCAVVGSPIVSGPPHESINVFPHDGKGSFDRLTHEQIANMEPHFQRVAAIGTGLMLVDCAVFKAMPQPWFEDIYQPDEVDEQGNVHRDPQYDVSQSQDTAFCFKVNDMGGYIFCNHYAPAGHAKTKICLPPACKGD